MPFIRIGGMRSLVVHRRFVNTSNHKHHRCTGGTEETISAREEVTPMFGFWAELTLQIWFQCQNIFKSVMFNVFEDS